MSTQTHLQSLCWGYSCRYTTEEGGEGRKRKGGRGTETAEKGVTEKLARTDKRYTKIDTEAQG